MADMDLGALLKRQSEAAKLAKLEYVHLHSISPDPRNFYDVSDVENLIESIQEQGLQQPLMVRTDPDHAGRVIVISGHRRLEALLELDAAKELPDPEHIPVIRNDSAKTPEEQEYQLILGNKDTRILTDYEMQEQAKRLGEILLSMKAQGHTFTGRTRDKVAELMDISKSKLSRLQAISKHLAPCWHAIWVNNVVSESVAYELQQAPEHHQKIIFEELAKENPGDLTAASVKVMREKMKAVDQMTCPDGLAGDFGCANRDGKLRHICHESERDVGTVCTVCCADCCNLATCKWACPHLADQITEAKRKRAAVQPTTQHFTAEEAAQKYQQEMRREAESFMDFMRQRGFDLLMRPRLNLGATRAEGIEGLKREYGASHMGGYEGEIAYQCERKGFSVRRKGEKEIYRSWTEVWDAMTLIAMERAQAVLNDDDDDVPNLGTVPMVDGWIATGHPEHGKMAAIKYTIDGTDDKLHQQLAVWLGGWCFPSGAPMDCIKVQGWSPVPAGDAPNVPNSGTEPQQDAGWHYLPELPEKNRKVTMYEENVGYTVAVWDGTSWVDPDDWSVPIVCADPDRWAYLPEEE